MTLLRGGYRQGGAATHRNGWQGTLDYIPANSLPVPNTPVEAYEVKTVDDLLASTDKRVELIDGEILRRPMARAEHSAVPGNSREGLSVFNRRGGAAEAWRGTKVRHRIDSSPLFNPQEADILGERNA